MLVNCSERKKPPESKIAIIAQNGMPGTNVAQAMRKTLLTRLL